MPDDYTVPAREVLLRAMEQLASGPTNQTKALAQCEIAKTYAILALAKSVGRVADKIDAAAEAINAVAHRISHVVDKIDRVADKLGGP